MKTSTILKLLGIFAFQWGAAWLMWLWRHPLGCPDFTEAVAMKCSDSATAVYILYLIAVDGVLILAALIWHNHIKKWRRRRAHQG